MLVSSIVDGMVPGTPQLSHDFYKYNEPAFIIKYSCPKKIITACADQFFVGKVIQNTG